jgi:hypothetical protein
MFKPNDMVRVTRSNYMHGTQPGDIGYVSNPGERTTLVKMHTGTFAGKFRVISNSRLELRHLEDATPKTPSVPEVDPQDHVRIIFGGTVTGELKHASATAAARWLVDEDLHGSFELVRCTSLGKFTL